MPTSPIATLRHRPHLLFVCTLCTLLSNGCRSADTKSPAGERTDDPTRLDAPGEVHLDRWGIPHIYAQTEEDAVLLQGWATANLRLGQIELLRRQAQGRLAEVLGESALADDQVSRSLRFAELGEAVWARVQTEDPDLARLAEAYAAGVNARIAEIEAGDAPNPAALTALGIRPEPFLPVHIFQIESLIVAGSSLRIAPELLVGLAGLLLDSTTFSDLYPLHPLDPAVVVPDWTLPPNPPASPAAFAPLPHTPEQLKALAALATAWPSLRPLPGGSNSFALAGSRTADGAALLESDTHQGLGAPPVYTLVHLDFAEDGQTISVVGASFAGTPFVLFGHNGQIAWSPTNGLLDHSDLYLEVRSGDTVSHLGEPVAIERDTVSIGVRTDSAGTQRTVEFEREFIPHHGPLLPVEALGIPIPVSVSVSWMGFEQGTLAPVLRDLSRANSHTDFLEALRSTEGATRNFAGLAWLYADRTGSIGASVHTELPLRERVDPARPPIGLLDGQGGYEWLRNTDHTVRTIDPSLLPHTLDPTDGLLTAANNDPSGASQDGDPFEGADQGIFLGGIFDTGGRAARLHDLLETRSDWDLDSIQAVQHDGLATPVLHLLPYLLSAASRRPDLLTPDEQWAIDILSAWDGSCDPEAVAPTLAHAFVGIFLREMLEDDLGGLLSGALFGALDAPPALTLLTTAITFLDRTAADIDAIEAGELPFPSNTGRNYFDDSRTPELETRDALLLSAFSQTLAELPNLCPEIAGTTGSAFQTALAACTWGRVHTIRLVHPASESTFASLFPEGDLPPEPKTGGLNTVDVGDFRLLTNSTLPASFSVTNASSNRFLWHLDETGITGRVSLPGGQHEDPDSPHFDDLYAEWLAGDLVPLPYTRAEVEAASETLETFPSGWPTP